MRAGKELLLAQCMRLPGVVLRAESESVTAAAVYVAVRVFRRAAGCKGPAAAAVLQ